MTNKVSGSSSSLPPSPAPQAESSSFTSLKEDLLKGVVDRVVFGREIQEQLASKEGKGVGFLLDNTAALLVERLYDSQALSVFCVGLPLMIDIPAEAISASHETFLFIHEHLDLLSDAEREVFLKQLPPRLRAPLEKHWRSYTWEKMAVIGSGISKVSSFCKRLGRQCVSDAFSLVSKVGNHMVTSVMSKEKQAAAVCVMETSSGRALTALHEKANEYLPALTRRLHWPIQTLFGKMTEHVQILDTTLQQFDQLGERLPPRALGQVVFSSLSAFTKMKRSGSPTSEETALSALFQAAGSNELPSPEMNQGLSELAKGGTSARQIEQRLLSLLKGALVDTTEDSGLASYYKEHHLSQLPENTLILVKTAFCVRQQTGVSPGIRFLADLVLLDPKRALIDVKKGCTEALSSLPECPKARESAEKKQREDLAKGLFNPGSDRELHGLELRYYCLALLEGNLPEEMRLRVNSFLALAEGTIHSAFSPAGLIETVEIFHAKTTLYPQMLKSCLPKDAHLLLQGMEKMLSRNLEEEMGISFAQSFVQEGIGFLTNTHSVSTLILQKMQAPTDHLQRYAPPVRWEGSAFPLQRVGNEAELGSRAAEEVAQLFEKRCEAMPGLKKFLAESLGSELLKNVQSLTQRADWGLFMIHLTSGFSNALKDPASVKPLSLTDPAAWDEVQKTVSGFFPLFKWVPRWIAKFLLEFGEKMLGNFHYGLAVSAIRDQIRRDRVLSRLANVLPPSVPAEEIAFGLTSHLEARERAFENAQLPFDKGAYLQSLLEIKPGLLLERLNQASSEIPSAG